MCVEQPVEKSKSRIIYVRHMLIIMYSKLIQPEFLSPFAKFLRLSVLYLAPSTFSFSFRSSPSRARAAVNSNTCFCLPATPPSPFTVTKTTTRKRRSNVVFVKLLNYLITFSAQIIATRFLSLQNEQEMLCNQRGRFA